MNILQEIDKLEQHYKSMLHLTANENVLSCTARKMRGYHISNRYNMGAGINGIVVQGRSFSAKAIPELLPIAQKCTDFINAFLEAEISYLNCLSGVHAMLCSILSLTQIGDAILSVKSTHGGHFCTKGVIESSGRKHVYAEYNLDQMTFDIDEIEKIYRENNAKAIYLDVSVYLKPHPIRQLRKALGPDALIIFDASHTLGLILGGVFQNPLQEGADVVCANTHKTFPGPQKGIIAFKNLERGEKAIHFIEKNLISSVHTGELLALYITILEMQKYGKLYAEQIVRNANELGSLLEHAGLECRKISHNTYTQTHQLHVYVDTDRVKALERFLSNNISTTMSRALGDQLFARIGVQEITRLGLKEKDMHDIAGFIAASINGKNVSHDVKNYMNNMNTVHYSFDNEQ